MFKLEERSLLAPVASKPAKKDTASAKTKENEKDSKSKPKADAAAPPSEVTSQQKTAYIRVMWNLAASADVVHGIARERR